MALSSSTTRPEGPAVSATGLCRTYNDGTRSLRAVNEISLIVERGERVAVMGPSGSGKTTLLHLLGGLDTPDSGSVSVMGIDWATLHGDDRAAFRQRVCGYVLQGLSLLPQATAAENVEVPLLLAGTEQTRRQTAVAQALERVGLTPEANKLPDQLSGGQQQRIAIARALVNDPSLVLADEPTGSLDSTTAQIVVHLLLDVARERKASLVLVTHDPVVAAQADRTVRLRSGQLEPTPVRANPRER